MAERAARDFLKQHIDLAKTRLSDADALTLVELVKGWSKYAGRAVPQVNEYDGWASDGKYTVRIKTTTTFLKDQVGFLIESERFIDGKSDGPGTYLVTNGREILNLLRDKRWLLDDRFAR